MESLRDDASVCVASPLKAFLTAVLQAIRSDKSLSDKYSILHTEKPDSETSGLRIRLRCKSNSSTSRSILCKQNLLPHTVYTIWGIALRVEYPCAASLFTDVCPKSCKRISTEYSVFHAEKTDSSVSRPILCKQNLLLHTVYIARSNPIWNPSVYSSAPCGGHSPAGYVPAERICAAFWLYHRSFIVRAMRFFCKSTDSTFTCTTSPSFTASSGCLI